MICYDLFLAWFCSYDFDTVSVMILVWFQLWYLMWVKIVILMGFWMLFSCKLRHLSFEHVVSCALDWLAFRWGNANSSMVWAQLGKTQVHPHNCITTVSKPYQNHIKTTKTLEKSTKRLSRGCFSSLFWNQPIGNPKKGAPFPNHIKTIWKSYSKHSKAISEP
jgi:type VI protein secretion system component VasK